MPNRYALAYAINDGDPQPMPYAPPEGLSRLQGRDYLRALRIDCKRRGYTVTVVDCEGNFTASRDGHTAAVWLEQMSSAREWAYEEQSAWTA